VGSGNFLLKPPALEKKKQVPPPPPPQGNERTYIIVYDSDWNVDTTECSQKWKMWNAVRILLCLVRRLWRLLNGHLISAQYVASTVRFVYSCMQEPSWTEVDAEIIVPCASCMLLLLMQCTPNCTWREACFMLPGHC
jgi:hypothetical protein